MSERRGQGEDWREQLGREFNRPPPGAEPRRDPPRPPGGGSPPGRGPGQGGGRRGDPPPGGLPPGYLREGYFDEGGYLRPELIVELAHEIAQRLDRAGLTMGALRRFFRKARRAESRLDAERSFRAVRGDILALKPFAANAQTRKVIPPTFREFIDRNVEQAVAGEREFRDGFLLHFQYVVAYFPRTG